MYNNLSHLYVEPFTHPYLNFAHPCIVYLNFSWHCFAHYQNYYVNKGTVSQYQNYYVNKGTVSRDIFPANFSPLIKMLGPTDVPDPLLGSVHSPFNLI